MAAKKAPAIKTKYTKSAIIDSIAGSTELSKKQVNSVLDELTTLIERHIKKGGAGEFALPGLMKISVPPDYRTIFLPVQNWHEDRIQARLLK